MHLNNGSKRRRHPSCGFVLWSISPSRVLIQHRSCCHGNMHLNDDSKSQRSIPIASRVIINPIDVRGRQGAHDDKSHTSTYVAGRVHVTINPIHVRCGQNAREVYNYVITAICICCGTSLLLRVFPSVIAEWPYYEAGVRADGEGV